MGSPESNLPPGFRFHPTDEELILHYLRKKVASIPLPVSIIAEVDIYKLDPWDLPAKAAFGEKEWYFFSPRDRKYPNGARPNRAAASGYWKATGTDKTIMASPPGGTGHGNIGVKKALVFYKGKPPKGVKTNWIMHEYRLVDNHRPIKLKDTSMRLDDWVLCRIYKKSKFTISPTEGGTVVGDQDQTEENNSNLFLKDTLFPISKSQSPTPTPPPPQPAHQNTLIPQKSVSFSNLLDAMDYSMLSSFLSDQNHNHHSNNTPQGIIGFGSSSSSSPPPPPSLGFNIGNMDHHNQQPHSQINTSISSSSNNNNHIMFHQKNNNNPSSSVTNNSMENNNMMMRPKRQILSNIDEEEETLLLHPSKKYLMNSSSSSSSCSFSNNNTNNPQYEINPQWNYLMKQSLLNQQLLLGPHLRFQG